MVLTSVDWFLLHIGVWELGKTNELKREHSRKKMYLLELQKNRVKWIYAWKLRTKLKQIKIKITEMLP